MKLAPLLEAKQHPALSFINKIAQLLFKRKAGPVIDLKRSKRPAYLGIAHAESTLTDDNGRHLMLTFDNSTDSGEFELNSLSPLLIEKGSQLDQELKKMYDEHEVPSVKKVNYTVKDGRSVIRELHLGKTIDERTLRFVTDVVSALKSNKSKVKG